MANVQSANMRQTHTLAHTKPTKQYQKERERKTNTKHNVCRAANSSVKIDRFKTDRKNNKKKKRKQDKVAKRQRKEGHTASGEGIKHSLSSIN